MSNTQPNNFDRVLRSLENPEQPQPMKGKAGDPQRVALSNYLLTCLDLTSNDVIVDLGSGRGALVGEMLEVWSGKECPCYVAVDRPEFLDDLSLPRIIHNNSKKVDFEQFLTKTIAELKNDIKRVVVRNVFHELNIMLTGRVLASLGRELNPGTEIYIQDMGHLAKPEKNNAGWDFQLFMELLEEIGFECRGREFESHGGTRWFVVLAKTTGHSKGEQVAGQLCHEKRKQHRNKLSQKQKELSIESDGATTPAYVTTALEISHIGIQLGDFEAMSQGTLPDRAAIVGGHSVYFRPGALNQAAFVSSDTEKFMNTSGLLGLIQNKDALDIPALIERSHDAVLFAGYSLKYMLALEPNKVAVKAALTRGVKVRLLISNPNSEVVALRTQLPVYKTAQELRDDISDTINAAINLQSGDEVFAKAIAEKQFDLRRSDAAPSCSYFIIDELCFFSLYTADLSGTLAPCIAAKRIQPPNLGYYELLSREFTSAFEASQTVFEAPDEKI